jgi:hypothetical protein
MPSTSRAQHKYFEWIAHDPAAPAKTGVPQAVAREFVKADKGRSLSKLPQHKAEGGAVSSYPKKFRW